MHQELSGKVALVTGGSRGIGAALATALAARGADVAITYLSGHDKAAAVIEALLAHGVRARAFCVDQSDPAAAAPLVAAVIEHFGRLNILVNNAGISTRQEVGMESDIPALDRIWAVNAIGVVATIRAAARVMTDGARIITIGSGAGTRSGLTGLADYSGSKAAVGGYTRGAAHDLGPRGITVNLIESGLMATELGDSIPEDIKAMLVANLAIKRFGQLDEIAAAVTFLASPSASYITGATLAVDGGFAA
jgi:NAD(P)-dependent dehydrogenase (short-subunit alcohol dehydrogenase family)